MSTTEQPQQPQQPFDLAGMAQLYTEVARKSGELLTRAMQKAAASARSSHLAVGLG